MSQLSAQVKEMAVIQGDYYATRKVFDEGSEDQILSKNTQLGSSLLPAGHDHDAYGTTTANRGAEFGVVRLAPTRAAKCSCPLNVGVHQVPYGSNKGL